MRKFLLGPFLLVPLLALECFAGEHPAPRRLEILFLGHHSKHHDSEKLAEILSQEYFKQGINITYTTDLNDLNQPTLSKYDGLIIYANHDSISPAQETALLNFVKQGKGFIPLHCASYCFRNSPQYIELVGGQFKTHKLDSFSVKTLEQDHPVMKGVPAFATYDETYMHDQISPQIEVLQERVEGDHHEPYTWVRHYGKGRVFYTAFGHDEHTWRNPGFLKLVENGILWAVGEEARRELAKLPLPHPKYTDAKIPNYEHRNPPPQLQEPLSAIASQLLTQVPVDFEMQLFAEEPDVVKPISMTWDEKGRLWVLETVDYPNAVLENKEQGNDRIKICEDTDGDGRADKFTVFADHLNIPTSLTLWKDGVIVSQAPYFLYLRDTNGDDKADVRDTLITGWGTYDTHAGPSNLCYGFDNQIWGTVGYSGFAGTIGGKAFKFGQGLYHFTPDAHRFEYLGATSNNTWGLGFDENFNVFLSTANNTHSAYFGIPNRDYALVSGLSAQGVEKIDGHYAMHVVTKNLRQVDVHGGFTAAAGHHFYTARNFPKEYWNRIAFVCEPTGRVVHRAIIEPVGAGFAEKDGWNMVQSADEWFGPVQAEVGPDGNLWVLDWYNFIIQHNPTPEGFENGKGNAYINPLRDRQRGRIYRIKYKYAKPYQPLALNKNDPQALVKALQSDNLFWRMTAQRLLVEAGNQAVLPQLYRLVRNNSTDELGLNAPAIHALWTMKGLGALEGNNKVALQVAVQALHHPAAGVRKAAVQVLPRTTASASAILDAKLLDDADLHTRLAVLLAVAEMPASDEIGKALFAAAQRQENEQDKWLSQALFIAGTIHVNGFMLAFNRSGISENPGLGKASLVQRIAMRSRFRAYSLQKWNRFSVNDAPDLTGKQFIFSFDIEKGTSDLNGVIAAQGTHQQGYTLYARDGQLFWLLYQDGKATMIHTTQPLPARFNLVAKCAQDGDLSLEIDGSPLAKGKLAGMYKEKFTAGLQVGFDGKGTDKLGDYPDNFNFTGYLNNGRLELVAPVMKQAAEQRADQVIHISTVKNAMKFDQTFFTVRASTTVAIVFENPDYMQHNLLILQKGSLEKVGAAADQLAQDPKGINLNYTPNLPEVLQATPLINPQGSYQLRFKAPPVPGDYPYICSYPGHWRLMKGIMKVVK